MTGSVVERTPQGTRPVGDAGVNLWVDMGRYAYSYWWANGQVHSGADGSFQLPNLPGGSGLLQTWKDGYVQQCAAPAVSLDTNPNLQAELVARTNLIVDPQQIPASVPGRIVSGRILEDGPSGTQPVAGASIDFETIPDNPAASTYSAADGRYLLCGVTDGSIGVGAAGHQVKYVPVPRDQGLNVSLDVVLP
jgi:hypothetical protein